MRTEFRVEIGCKPLELWPYLDEADKQRAWLTTLVDIVSTSKQPRAVGSTFDLRVREGRRVTNYEGRINAYDPPRHLGVSFWGGAFPPNMVMRVDYRIAELPSGCRLEYYAEVNLDQLRGPIKLALPIARVFTYFQLRHFMRNLKRVAEESALAGSDKQSPPHTKKSR